MYNLQTAIIRRDNSFIHRHFWSTPYKADIESAAVNELDDVFVFPELTFSWGHINSE